MGIQSIVRESLQTKVLTLTREAFIQTTLWENLEVDNPGDRHALMMLIVAIRAGEVKKQSRIFAFEL